MSRPEDLKIDAGGDERGDFIKVSATLRSVQQLDFLVEKLPVFQQFIQPEIQISALAADQFVDGDIVPIVVPALRLVS